MSGEMAETNVLLERAEERNSVADQDRNMSDRDSLNEPVAQESLNCDSTVDIEMPRSLRSKLRDDFGWSACHLFDRVLSDWRQIESAVAQYDNALRAIRPLGQGEDGLECLAPDHNDIDRGNEFLVAVRLAALRRQKVEIAVWAGDKPIEANADKDRCLYAIHSRNDSSFLLRTR